MKSHRQPGWAFLVIILWLVCGGMLIVSLGVDGNALFDKVMVGVFVFLTLAMARAVHILMDREEKALPGWALSVMFVLAVFVAAGVLLRR
jgi:hypothetical protein